MIGTKMSHLKGLPAVQLPAAAVQGPLAAHHADGGRLAGPVQRPAEGSAWVLPVKCMAAARTPSIRGVTTGSRLLMVLMIYLSGASPLSQKARSAAPAPVKVSRDWPHRGSR